jgi:hypothetical protein
MTRADLSIARLRHLLELALDRLKNLSRCFIGGGEWNEESAMAETSRPNRSTLCEDDFTNPRGIKLTSLPPLMMESCRCSITFSWSADSGRAKSNREALGQERPEIVLILLN